MNQKEYEASQWLHEALHAQGRTREAYVRKIQEAIGSSALPKYMSPAMNGILMKEYGDFPTTWADYAERETVASPTEATPYYEFELDDSQVPSKRGGKSTHKNGLAAVAEFEAYPAATLRSSEAKLATRKNGLMVPLSWEAVKNGKVDIIPRIMKSLGRRAKEEENFAAASVLVDANGVNAKNFTTARKNLLPGNPELTYESLRTAIQFLGTVEYNGRRIAMPAKYVLVVPSALAQKAHDIVSIKEVRTTEGNDTFISSNSVAGKIAKVVEVPELGMIGGAKADKAWFLLPVPGSMPNPGVVNVFLLGHEAPVISVKSTTNIGPDEGEFDDDTWKTKIRHFVSGGMLKSEATLASKGDKSA